MKPRRYGGEPTGIGELTKGKKTAGLPLQPHVGGTYGFSSPALLGDKALVLSGGDSSANHVESNSRSYRKPLDFRE